MNEASQFCRPLKTHRPPWLIADVTRGLSRPSSSSSLDSDVTSKCAYVTFLCDDSEYWKGAVVLAKSLRSVGSRYELIVAVTKEVSPKLRQLLTERHGCIVREIEVSFQ